MSKEPLRPSTPFAERTDAIYGKTTRSASPRPRGWAARWARWAPLREKAGINPDDETADMYPSDARTYKLLSEEEPVTCNQLARTLYPDLDIKKAKSSAVSQSMARLRKMLPSLINRSVVNVGTPRHAEYLLVEAGREQEVIERYAREREEKQAETTPSRLRVRAAELSQRMDKKSSKTQLKEDETELEEGVEATVSRSDEDLQWAQRFIEESGLDNKTEKVFGEEESQKLMPREHVQKSPSLKLTREDQYWLAMSIVDFNGQYVITDELGKKIGTETLDSFRRVLSTRGSYVYSAQEGQRIRVILNQASNNNTSFMRENGHHAWISRALELLTPQDNSKSPGDVFWEIYEYMHPRPAMH
ncbi:MAG: hypothetical protein A3C30_02800 [Candidatus Levybacteria bacterium RIFCSPHIGHO2_02_FULL_40_18]|nr:MAG: hypothetical protein A2869_05180 [Candidatus Levybacteria bacterium RIFCSPHIGHO2_01_FULL_40_58]OGH26904.1 MAG: hypothetical protein A3C30_02800 [Candidatus Levybacteria bacterium RIFCSPHIGHO2_02_FULL_40_18]OGH32026.1 MAG: hypothetical protein A3E43_03780 [Candidatus Levybacteria bacterium RIFCSPHIGHO2_12_FULL_40_31]OGH40852.1 MAG: hypothetical protein A2894_04620 [Candidatus Levybacteria bacterium RIFCSPLOWO2_01_FULL_40_64]OGH52773.1 MAG: hypothetical protein A3G15_00370 [Candidatus Lev